ncbi:uncharacterized protein LOC126795468 [Argentina anserina]|uniref:uncharacterized protein LOC126795468 n=1 Tax=Argentina anserina TaxID=57926 RepID=UPI0021768615|nr:uncharacterized protein LOC126795468 [Potentilla anserina]
MGSKSTAAFFIFLICMVTALPPIQACGPCTQSHPPQPPKHRCHSKSPSHPKHPPHNGGGGEAMEEEAVVVVEAEVVVIRNGGGGGGGRGKRHPPLAKSTTCPIDSLQLGLCVDVLGGLVRIGLGDPVENVCCPVLQGLFELEAAICLCTIIRLRLLNLNIYIPLALQALITCSITPPPGFVCPPL